MDTLKTATLLLAAGVEAAAALVIGLAAIEATVRALLLFVPRPGRLDEPDATELVRLRLGPAHGPEAQHVVTDGLHRSAAAAPWPDDGY